MAISPDGKFVYIGNFTVSGPAFSFSAARPDPRSNYSSAIAKHADGLPEKSV